MVRSYTHERDHKTILLLSTLEQLHHLPMKYFLQKKVSKYSHDALKWKRHRFASLSAHFVGFQPERNLEGGTPG